MDLRESQTEVIDRHPWELSRTYCTLRVFSRYINRIEKECGKASYINVGAGDLYFDRALLRSHKKTKIYAVDLEYKEHTDKDRRIQKYHYLEEIEPQMVDYAFMMDSLEYMEDDITYVKNLTKRVKNGGYLFFTLPAHPILFSDYDVNIFNLRRYSRKSFAEVLKKVGNLKVMEKHDFYFSLFFIRFFQKFLRFPIDPNHNFTANWKFNKKHLLTKVLVGCLNLDFFVCRFLEKLHIHLPGLSLLVVCQKMSHG